MDKAWKKCQRHFAENHGLLPDIYVHGTTIEHWQTLYEILGVNYRLEYFVDNESEPLPGRVDEVFATREIANPELYFRVGGVLVACHFFTREEIEFDIDPAEVTSEVALNHLQNFVALVG